MAPCDPFGPSGPCGPRGPWGPWSPGESCPDWKLAADSEPAFTFDAETAPGLIFEAVTAFFLSCLAPTLFIGIVSAYAPPLSATTSAIIATTLENVRPERNLASTRDF